MATIQVRVPPLVRLHLESGSLWSFCGGNRAESNHGYGQAGVDMYEAVTAAGPRTPVSMSVPAAEILAELVAVQLMCATDDGTASERAACKRTLNALSDQGVLG